MNKTRKRAIQKHRAKELKFEARRKAGQEVIAGGPRAKATAPAATSRPRSNPRPAPVAAEAAQE